MIPVPHSTVQSDVAYSKTELRYKKLLSSVDLTKDFFYSYTYPIMRSLQKNVQAAGGESMPYENIFVWNTFLTRAIRSRCSNAHWTIALVHGYFKQARLSVFGREFSIVLISRRSRHFAGTRYLKRGVNDWGRVANDVETEQIVLDEEAGTYKGGMSSIVQMRGSIPLFWSQEASRFSPKPDIIGMFFVHRYDPTYEATKLHFEDLVKRYGNPIIILNLIKTVEKRPREMMLRREFAHAVGYLNQILPEDMKLKFIHWDFHKFAKSKAANVLAVLGSVASEALDLTGFYFSGKPVKFKKRATQLSLASKGREASLGDLRSNSSDVSRVVSNNDLFGTVNPHDQNGERCQQPRLNGPCFQSGVLRTNCIDCLDRTNVSQYACGLEALGRQLQALGLTDTPKVDHDSSVAAALMEMYQSMGDALAQQYGGSAAHNTVFPERQGKWKATTQSREFLKSIKRYYSNAYTDGEKQDAMNLFLGYFQPQEGKPALWDLDSDYYLHVFGIGEEPFSDNERLCLHVGVAVEGTRPTIAPIPACKKDFYRMKLTSFDKLIQATCSSVKNVRLWVEPVVSSPGTLVNSGMAADARDTAQNPNWLFGQRKNEDCVSTAKVKAHEVESEEPSSTMILWYGAGLLYYQDESSEAYKHYAELCQGPATEHFGHDVEEEQHYREALSMGLDCGDVSLVEEEMEAAVGEYSRIGTDLGILPNCKALAADDPSQLTRWIIGYDKLPCQVAESN
ncbi:unnamed protein product [Spirodela intermedia]|uniref:SAC domain-containing protein n=1 Tax=Spirodela intermedia TaxID=51605 RepID=A0A7I8JDN2_SPIIN|nr:unnamed protein product [Spirodela intermedia]CAA6668284.1 unnamed protein product [Spirodela intermedia]